VLNQLLVLGLPSVDLHRNGFVANLLDLIDGSRRIDAESAHVAKIAMRRGDESPDDPLAAVT
jgi:hypothetical protein